MLILWRIRYFDTRDKTFNDRDLLLDTDSVDAQSRAVLETIDELRLLQRGRAILQFRHLFVDRRTVKDDLAVREHAGLRMSCFCIPDYFEDENGQVLTRDQLARLVTGRQDIIALPPGAGQHDVEYMLSDMRAIDLERLSPTQEQLDILGIFSRDLSEMKDAMFFKEGPGVLKGEPGGSPRVETSVTDDEIRSFVTIFRRLYMTKDPATFGKAVAVFATVARGYPITDWVQGEAAEYLKSLDEAPSLVPFGSRSSGLFTRKRLIDVYLYTQYAHQPNRDRLRQYQDCLAAVGGQQSVLTWMFLSELWQSAHQMQNVGRVIASVYSRYCKHHKIAHDVLASLKRMNPNLGLLEKRSVQRERVLQAKASELAESLWSIAGRPRGGPEQFFDDARRRLDDAIGSNDL